MLYNRSVTILSGGVGGAKFVLGMAQCISPSNLNVIVNTADDSIFHGLHVAPDLDTVMYTLAEMANPITGWGLAEDTFNTLHQLEAYGQKTWFQLGDKDLGTHILRTKLLKEKKRLTRVTSLLSRELGVKANVLPMTDDKVETHIRMGKKWMPFQEYFILSRGKRPINSVKFKGVQSARPSLKATKAITKTDLIIFAPSNPVVSILPILSLKGFKEMLKKSRAFKVAISPFISNQAVSGPAKELMEAIGQEGSSFGTANLYKKLIDLFIIDELDVNKKNIEVLGLEVKACKIVMKNLGDKIQLAESILRVEKQRTK